MNVETKKDEVIQDAPAPALTESFRVEAIEHKLHRLRNILGEGLLHSLTGYPPEGLKAAALHANDSLCERVVFLDRIAYFLSGSYNSEGIRRWFERPRSELNHQSPAEVLATNWTPSDPAATKLLQLALGLQGS